MVIAYVGCERCDMVYYMSRIAINSGKTVLIVDNSKKGDLYRSLSNGTGNRKDTNYGSIVRNCDITADETDAFDFVFLYHGESVIDMPYDIACDILYVACEVTQLALEDALEALESTKLYAYRTVFVAREVVNEKFTPQAMAAYLKVKPSDYLVIPLSEDDCAKYNGLLNGGEQLAKNCSKDMQFLLQDYVKLAYNENEKNAKRIVSRN